MSQKTFTISTEYMLSAINKNGTRVYYAIDDQSAGYPWWSEYVSMTRKFQDITKIPTFKGTDYMRTDVVSIEVLKVDLRAKIIGTTEIVSEVKANAMAEIDKIQKELARKIATLEGM